LRDLTRFRAQLASEPTRLANRLLKVLEDATIELAAVATDILRKSGRAVLRALIRGELALEKLAELAERRLRAKIPGLKLALEGHFTGHYRFLVEHRLGHLDELERHVEEMSNRIRQRLRPVLDEARLKQLDAIAGGNLITLRERDRQDRGGHVPVTG
jgi:hypothetical protein